MKRFLSYLLLIIILPLSVCADKLTDRFDYLEEEVREYSILDKDYALRLIEEMRGIVAQSPDSLSLKARMLYSRSLLNQWQGIADSTLYYEIEGQLKNPSLNDYDKIILNYALSCTLSSFNDYSESFDISLNILEQAKQLNDSLLVARIYNTLAGISHNVSLSEMSKEYLREAMEWIPSNSQDYIYYLVKSNIYTTELLDPSIDKEQKQLMIDSIQSFSKILEEKKKYGILLLLLLNTSHHWSPVGQDEINAQYLNRAQELCKNNPYVQSMIEINLGAHYLYEKNKPNTALDYLLHAKETMENNNLTLFLPIAYHSISLAYEKKNRLEDAMFYMKESFEMREMNRRNMQIVDVHRKYITASLEASENRLALARTEVDMNNKRFLIILISAIAFVIISVMTFVIVWQKQRVMRQRVKLKEAESNELTLRLEKEQSLKKLQEKQLEDKLREITSYSLQVASKNQALNQIAEVTKEFPDGDKLMKKKIKGIIKDNQQTDNDWNDFLLHFNNVHPHFFERLHEACPDISQTELRLAAYIRLNLSIKQIAQMLNVTPESVKTSRYRLRKKMDLTKEDNLDSVILTL